MLKDEDVKALGEGHYERRTLAFFDVLGWKGRVDRAARNPHRLAELRLVTLGLGATRGIGFEEQGGRLTSFSDNVVISIPFAHETLQEFLELVSRIQVGLAMWGFFIRGGITVGDVLHDASSLFGPALIRAYELESKHAKYPRLIFDPGIPELKEIEDYVMQDGDIASSIPSTMDSSTPCAGALTTLASRNSFLSMVGPLTRCLATRECHHGRS